MSDKNEQPNTPKRQEQPYVITQGAIGIFRNGEWVQVSDINPASQVVTLELPHDTIDGGAIVYSFSFGTDKP